MTGEAGSQRPSSGLDVDARGLLLAVVLEVARLNHQEVVSRLFEGRHASVDGYLGAVGRAHGVDARRRLKQAMGVAVVEAEFPADPSALRGDPNEAAARALLLAMPEPDLRLAAEQALGDEALRAQAASQITMICRDHGVPWAFSRRGFERTDISAPRQHSGNNRTARPRDDTSPT